MYKRQEYKIVSIPNHFAKANGNLIGFYLHPFGNVYPDNIRLGRLPEGEKVVVIGRTETKELMKHRNGEKRYDYYYQILFTDDKGNNGKGWIRGVWLDFINVNPDQISVITDVDEKREFKPQSQFIPKGIDKPTIRTRSNRKYLDVSISPELKMSSTFRLSTDEVIGTAIFNVCVNKNGDVITKTVIKNNFENRKFINTMNEQIENARFEKRDTRVCGKIEIKVYNILNP